MSEASVQREALRRIRRIDGVWIEKIAQGAYSAAGIPDALGCARGHLFGIEFKNPERYAKNPERGLTARQKLTLDAIRAAGGSTLVTASADEAEDFVRTLSERKPA